MTTTCQFDVVRRKRDAASATFNGFATDAVRAEMPCVVRLADLRREGLGDLRFSLVLQSCRACAAKIAPRSFFAEALYHNFQQAGYVFRFARRLDAARFMLHYQAVLSGSPSPFAEWDARK